MILENIYLVILVIIFALAILDLVVGVSNDATNFLSSAIGSKVASFRNIMIISSIGLLIGAVSSGGMMEVARKGIFNPDMFTFNDIMIVFISVMITDILLLNFYNSIGMPTSTTVSIVFELLGASFILGLYKVMQKGDNFYQVLEYINTSKALKIISGIFLSILIAFILGGIFQYFSRLIFTFDYEKKIKKIGAIFSSICITSISYFVLIKGLKSSSFFDTKLISEYYIHIILSLLVFFYIISSIIIHFTKINILKVVVLLGTFSIAMAFAGNDLVNFIGVSLGGLKSYTEFASLNIPADELYMTSLSGKVKPPVFLLLVSGSIMIVTLWLSKKAKKVLNTGINLSSENDVNERFNSNIVSRAIVRSFIRSNNFVLGFISPKARIKLRNRMKKNSINLPNDKSYEKPAFDLIRASVNLTTASIIISFATSLKLPLSTTYVSFMVAMGASLADGAWGRDSAVFRISGVLNVIIGWFSTAIIAFISCGIIALFINYAGFFGILTLLIVIAVILTKKSVSNKGKFDDNIFLKSNKEVQDIIVETKDNSTNFLKKINIIYSKTIEGGVLERRSILKSNKKEIKDLTSDIEEIKDAVFYSIRTLNNKSINASRMYVIMVDRQRRVLRYVSKIQENIFNHIDDNLKSFSKNQRITLEDINSELNDIFDNINDLIENKDFQKINSLESLIENHNIFISNKIDDSLSRLHKKDFSPKNTELFISTLLDTKEMLTFTKDFIKTYERFWIELS